MYIITFIDGMTFSGGHPSNSHWNEIPNKFIKKIIYKLDKHIITLKNYEEYNHIVEHVAFLQRGQAITKIILMGKKNNDVLKIIIDLQKKKIYSDIAIFGKEYNGKSISGWKEGIKGLTPKSLIE